MSYTQVSGSKYSDYNVTHVLMDTNTKYNHVRMRLDSSFNTSNANEVIKTIQFSTNNNPINAIDENSWSTCENIDLSASNPSEPTKGDTLFFDISATSLLSDHIYIRPVYKTEQTIGYDISYVVDLSNYMMKHPIVSSIQIYDCSKNDFKNTNDLSFVVLTKGKQNDITDSWKTNIGETDVSNVIVRYTFNDVATGWNDFNTHNVYVDASFGHSTQPNISMSNETIQPGDTYIDICTNKVELKGSGDVSFNLRLKRALGEAKDVSYNTVTYLPRNKIFDIPYDLSWNDISLAYQSNIDYDFTINLSGGTMIDPTDISSVYYSLDATNTTNGVYNKIEDVSLIRNTTSSFDLRLKGSQILPSETHQILWLKMWYKKMMNQEYFIIKNVSSQISQPDLPSILIPANWTAEPYLYWQQKFSYDSATGNWDTDAQMAVLNEWIETIDGNPITIDTKFSNIWPVAYTNVGYGSMVSKVYYHICSPMSGNHGHFHVTMTGQDEFGNTFTPPTNSSFNPIIGVSFKKIIPNIGAVWEGIRTSWPSTSNVSLNMNVTSLPKGSPINMDTTPKSGYNNYYHYVTTYFQDRDMSQPGNPFIRAFYEDSWRNFSPYNEFYTILIREPQFAGSHQYNLLYRDYFNYGGRLQHIAGSVNPDPRPATGWKTVASTEIIARTRQLMWNTQTNCRSDGIYNNIQGGHYVTYPSNNLYNEGGYKSQAFFSFRSSV